MAILYIDNNGIKVVPQIAKQDYVILTKTIIKL